MAKLLEEKSYKVGTVEHEAVHEAFRQKYDTRYNGGVDVRAAGSGPAVQPGATHKSAPSAPTVAPSADFMRLVKQERDKSGSTLAAAMAEVARKNPASHQAYINASNPNR